MNTDIIGRAVALVAGVIATGLALGVLLDDVLFGTAKFALSHAVTIGVVALAILALHLIGEAWNARHWLGVAGFAVLFVAATGLVVYKSTGRQAEHTFVSQAEADVAAERRTAAKAAIARAEAMLADAQRDLARECKSGRGKRCQGVEATLSVYEAAITGHRADLERLGPPRPVAPEAENFAAIASVFGADKAKVKAASVLIVPFLQTALLEFGSIICLSFAFRRRAGKPGNPAIRAIEAREPTIAERAQTSFYADDLDAARTVIIGGKPGNRDGGTGATAPKRPYGDDKPGNRGAPRKSSRQEFEADVLTRLALGQSIDRQDAFAHEHGVHPGSVSKWLKDMRERGLIPASQRVGRCHRTARENA